MNKKCLLPFISIVLCCFSFSCHFGTSGSWINENIDKNEREKIAGLNKQLFKALMNKDADGVKKLASEGLLQQGASQLDTIVNSVAEYFEAQDYKIVDEFYTKNTSGNIPNTLISSNAGSYFLNYLAINKEMYTSLLETNSKSRNALITVIYGKYGNDWKINILQINEFKVLGSNAPDYYLQAKKCYDKGYLVDAFDLITMANKLLRPAGKYMTYKQTGEIEDFYKKIVAEANTQYHLPLVINTIKSKPQILGVQPQPVTNGDKQGVFPFVLYKSEINMSDTVALKSENEALQKSIGTIFKGIDKDNSAILYRAVNQIPDGTTLIKHYGFVQKLR